MAELLILEFDGVTEADYRSVTKELGIDPDTMKGDWPAGLITHLAGMAEDAAAAWSRPGHLVRPKLSSCRAASGRRWAEAG